jgi:hypothetical protein
MLTPAEVPGLYVRPDTGALYVFDNIQAKRIASAAGTLRLRLTNPTKFPADVRVLSETAARAAKPLPPFPLRNARVIHLDPGGTVTALFR